MSRRAVRNGDPTTTGGVVIAVTSTMFNHGKQVALDGDKATRGNCEGAFPIVGGAHRMIVEAVGHQCWTAEDPPRVRELGRNADAVICLIGR